MAVSNYIRHKLHNQISYTAIHFLTINTKLQTFHVNEILVVQALQFDQVFLLNVDKNVGVAHADHLYHKQENHNEKLENTFPDLNHLQRDFKKKLTCCKTVNTNNSWQINHFNQ